ncbi:helix-turn-helix transcriptional regulator [Devosia neptuniae]|jgi:DNA-binding HxlR family transcriptional regulator|uniref:Helix-turn-helix transcriptional regulator n=1 Tax=Devosia neptuniae TaxID=191302 RepID=A0ABY6CGB3_9HYPH|nr:helix-turn-helix domain-containing protein [Devosia neptuniae]UXN71264.1 helix-turn-helix transcriptional regulator [Devosia neptuniae]
MSALSASHGVDHDRLVVKPGKWTLVVVMQLRSETRRFSELRRGIGEISQKTLTVTLRELERDGFVSRTIFPTIPPRVDYELTNLGREFLELADGWRQFAARNRVAVEAARHRFDSAAGDPAIRLISSS